MVNKIFILVFLTLGALVGHAQEVGEFKNLGAQLHSATPKGSAFVQDKAGNAYLYTVVQGRPAHLIGYDLTGSKNVVDLELSNTDGSWGIAASTDGILYISTDQGHLFTHMPGSQKVQDLGIALPGEKVIMDLVAGKNGEVFGGTYPGCRLFRYHPKEGFTDILKAPVVSDQHYARYLAYDDKTNKLYVGVRIGISVFEIDLNTGMKKQILPQNYLKSTSFHNLKLVRSSKGSQLLVGLTSNDGKRQTLVFDTKKGKMVDTLGPIDVRYLLYTNKSDIYYPANAKFYSGKLTKPSTNPLFTHTGEVKASRWNETGEVELFTSDGELLRYNLKSKKAGSIILDLPKQPINIQSIFFGPDKRVWSSGFLAGGNAAYDPVTKKTIEYSGLIQSEGISKQNESLYFGVYPYAQLYRYNTTKPWDVKKNNPRLIKQISGQSRPFAILSVDSAEKLYFGTVPEYGMLGGAITEYNAVTDEIHTYTNVIPKQSPTCLTYKDGLIWGGSSISGGLGVAPSEKEGKLFAWDPVKKVTTYETVPVKDNMAVTALIKGPDDNLWGIADGTFFIFDTWKKKIVHEQRIYNVPEGRSHAWRDAFLLNHPSGKVYGTGGQNFFVIDPATLKVNILRNKLSLLTMDDNGVLYLKSGADLWSYQP